MDYKEKYLKYKNKYLLLKQNQNIMIGGKKIKKTNKIEKLFNEKFSEIDYIKIQLKPYLKIVDENSNYVKIEITNKKLEKLFKEKLNKNYKKIITEGMLYQIQIIKYEYDSELNIVNIYLKPKIKYIQDYNNNKEIPSDLIEILYPYAKNIKYELEDGEQSWLDGDAVYIEKGEFDNKQYFIFAILYSCSLYYNNETKIIGYECDVNSKESFNNKCKYFNS